MTLRRILNRTAGLTVWSFPCYDKGEQVPCTVDVLEDKDNTMKVIASYKSLKKVLTLTDVIIRRPIARKVKNQGKINKTSHFSNYTPLNSLQFLL